MNTTQPATSSRMAKYISRQLLVKLAVLTVLWSALLCFVGTQNAHANVTLNPDPGPIPAYIRSILVQADSYSKTPAIVSWISWSGQPAQTTIPVNSGDPTVWLDYHFGAAVGWSASVWDVETRNRVSSVSVTRQGSPTVSYPASSVAGLSAGDILSLTTLDNTPGTYRHDQKTGFTFSPPGGFTSTGDYDITVTFRALNRYSNNVYQCVGGSETYVTSTHWNNNDYGLCQDYMITNTIQVTVPPPAGTVSGRVYNSSTGSGPGSSVTIDLCGGRTTTTNSDGYWSYNFTEYDTFCARVISGIPAGWNGPPQTNNNSEHVGSPTYEYQVAIGACYQNSTFCGAGRIGGNNEVLTWDRNTDSGYDFVYTGGSPVVTFPPAANSLKSDELGNAYCPDGSFINDGVYSSCGTWGGVYYGDTPLADWPFSDDCVRFDSGPCDTTNASSKFLSTGTHTVSVTPAGIDNGSWTVIGYRICSYYAGSGCQNVANGLGSSFSFYFWQDGIYYIRWMYSNTIPAPAGITKPYLRVYGGDVLAGSGFGKGCTATNASAEILTFNRGGAGSYQGAGTQMAAFALGNIDGSLGRGFASGGGGASAKQVSFSNTAGDAIYGGYYGLTYCAPDYWAGAPASPATAIPDIAGLNILNGTHPVQYVDGDVTITGDIKYTGSGGWTDLNQIPSYYLVVRGNIYIDRNVEQLDGVFVAMPDPGDPNSGKIYTCTLGSNPYSSPVPAGPNPGGCGNQLTINGAFIARQVKFLRTNGDVNLATAGELATSPNIAEVFVFGPELWAR